MTHDADVPAGPPLHEQADRDADNVPSETCAGCGRAAEGYARINGERYCHADDRDCYRRAQWDNVPSDRERAYPFYTDEDVEVAAEALASGPSDSFDRLGARLVLDAVAPALLARGWQEGWDRAESMARCWGHTDHWGEEKPYPANPYEVKR